MKPMDKFNLMSNVRLGDGVIMSGKLLLKTVFISAPVATE